MRAATGQNLTTKQGWKRSLEGCHETEMVYQLQISWAVSVNGDPIGHHQRMPHTQTSRMGWKWNVRRREIQGSSGEADWPIALFIFSQVWAELRHARCDVLPGEWNILRTHLLTIASLRAFLRNYLVGKCTCWINATKSKNCKKKFSGNLTDNTLPLKKFRGSLTEDTLSPKQETLFTRNLMR